MKNETNSIGGNQIIKHRSLNFILKAVLDFKMESNLYLEKITLALW